MGLGGYLTWTAAAREIRSIAGNNVKFMAVEQLENGFLKVVKSEVFKNNSDFFMHSDEEYSNGQIVFPLVLNNPNANYCKTDMRDRVIHRGDAHIIQQICECYGIKDPELKCVLNLTKEENAFANDYHSCVLNGDKFITIEPFSKSNYTNNRSYPFEKWQEIVNHICDTIKIVQVGNSVKVLDNVIDLTGKTTFREAAAIIGRSQLFLSSESGLVHCSTAVDTRSVVIITGYQSEKMVAYPQNINVNISSHGPCGLKVTCNKCVEDGKNHNWRDIVKIVREELCL